MTPDRLLTDTWWVLDRDTGQPKHTVRLWRSITPDIADRVTPTGTVMWNERTNQVAYQAKES